MERRVAFGTAVLGLMLTLSGGCGGGTRSNAPVASALLGTSSDQTPVPPDGVIASPGRHFLTGDMPVDRLMRAYVITQIEAGHLSVEDLIARASKL